MKKEVNKTDFPKLFKEAMVEKNKKSPVPEKVREGAWPFKVESGTLWKIDNCIFFECEYKRIITRRKLFALNGTAISNRKFYRASKIPNHLRLTHNIMAVNDLIEFGLNMKE